MRKLTFVAMVLAGALVGIPAVAFATARAPQMQPSKSATMICSDEGQKDIAAALGGTKPVSVTTPTWSDNRIYSCTYVYPSGAVTLSVKELPTKSATKSYFASLSQSLGRQGTKLPLGQAAFRTTNGSVVVRKDTKVLLVDVSRLTADLGVPPEKADQAAGNVAAAVLGCWTGA
jgi:hypothetical protein